MTRILVLLLCLAATAAAAEGFERPIPQAQSATAEAWFALASLALVLALWAVHWLVRRR